MEKESLVMNYKQYINGRWVDAQSGATWTVIDPATEAAILDVPFGDAADAEAAIAAAAAAQPKWAAMTAYERGAILRRVADLIYSRLDELAPIMTRECGKPLAEARGEWTACADLFDWFAEEGKRAYGRTIPPRRGHKRLLAIPMPVGVVATITAWNFPAYLPARKWSGALAAGCTVVARPSELTPMSAMALVNLLEEAGMPPGVLNLVNGQPAPIGEVFLRSPQVDKLSFTGSQAVGRLLMRNAAEGIKRLSLELGGSAPVLVFPDVDVEAVAKIAVAAKFRNNGQVCISPSRFYVHRAIEDDFIAASRAIVENLVVGPGLDPQVTTGPLVSAAARTRIADFVADAVERGAQVLTGGAPPPGRARGFFYAPTLLTNLAPQMRVMQEETFGPVMLLNSFDDMASALAQANNTPYGLAAYVLTNDLRTAIRAYEGLKFGIIGVNDMTPATAEAPFGGVKQSGFGREGAQEGLHEYMEIKFVSMAIEG
ncbi:MAG TPA: NAD-dependent succinate-semialdehyde dehydrogenase [Chloroflexi bacterium]|nr:NAD-dependent succinate-semialdehyde dehydrogenase [Chloroflexota bacterium]